MPVYLSGEIPPNPGPLSRFLPLLPDGLVAAWLSKAAPPGAWVLDPFGASPRQVVEAARAGYRVLVASNSPVNRFLIDVIANPPTQAEFKAALSDLGSSAKGEQRLEPLILGLYRTHCPNCQAEISAEAFIWERNTSQTVQKIIRCEHCNSSGEFPLSDNDQEQLKRLPPSSLHRARALERVTPLDDPDRALVEEALDTYLPRSLYALFTMVNKLDQLPGHHHRPLYALLLATFDAANSLWSHPFQRTRPRQLTIPVNFRENNIWLAMEEALNAWVSAYPARAEHIPIHYWPDLPAHSGSICLYEGRLRDLVEELAKLDQGEPPPYTADKPVHLPTFEAVIAPLPRPNQAYWTLSTLWSGWLWGREAALPLKMVLHRRRYDWNWHTAALHSGLSSLSRLLSPGTKIFQLIAETEPGFISATLLASSLAGFEDYQIALRESSPVTQIICKQTQNVHQKKTQPQGSPLSEQELQTICYARARPAALDFLAQRGQPAPYLLIHTTALRAIATGITSAAIPGLQIEPQDFTAQVQAGLGICFSPQAGFVRFHGSPNMLDSGLWWLYEKQGDTSPQFGLNLPSGSIPLEHLQPPLDERVEMEIVRLLLKQAPLSLAKIDKHLCGLFRGWFTPDLEWIQACLGSYAEQNPPDSGLWQLRPQEVPRLRRQDLDQAAKLLTNLGKRLGFSVSYQQDSVRRLTWQNPRDRQDQVFYLVVSAVISHLVSQPAYPKAHQWIVYPGGRAALLLQKLRRDPRLQAFVDQDWGFLKFRHLRRLADSDQIGPQNLLELFEQDPLTKLDSQISFF